MDGDDPWSENDIRAWGIFFGLVALGWLYLVARETARVRLRI